jgi:Fe-S cluster assembly protein SufD
MAMVEFDPVPTLTPDRARSLSERKDLQAIRMAAAERAGALALPSPDEEIWRYSRIDALDLERYTPGMARREVSGPAQWVHTGEAAEESCGVVMGEAPDLFAELNTAFATAITVRVPAGTLVPEPIVITHHVDTGAIAAFPRLVVDAGEDSELTVIERFVSSDGIDSLMVPVLELRAAPAARVRYLSFNDLGTDTWQIAHQRALGERDSSTLLATVALGGDYARVRTDARLVGRGASTRQVALYFADGDQMHDFRTTQHHAAPRTTSDLLFKGAVQDRARSVYTGLIKIRHDAAGSSAFQTNRTLTLSDGAWAESVPNLEIETNDVKCSHASTVGPIDDEQRFYLESRGIPPQIAERLVVLGFFDEVIDRLPAAGLATELRTRVATKLTGEDPS